MLWSMLKTWGVRNGNRVAIRYVWLYIRVIYLKDYCIALCYTRCLFWSSDSQLVEKPIFHEGQIPI